MPHDHQHATIGDAAQIILRRQAAAGE